MKNLTKQKLVNWLGDNYNNCGYTDYFGYKMSIENFKKEMFKKRKFELERIVFDNCEYGQKFVESFKK